MAEKCAAFLIDWSSSKEAGGSVFLIGPLPFTGPEGGKGVRECQEWPAEGWVL